MKYLIYWSHLMFLWFIETYSSHSRYTCTHDSFSLSQCGRFSHSVTPLRAVAPSYRKVSNHNTKTRRNRRKKLITSKNFYVNFRAENISTFRHLKLSLSLVLFHISTRATFTRRLITNFTRKFLEFTRFSIKFWGWNFFLSFLVEILRNTWSRFVVFV